MRGSASWRQVVSRLVIEHVLVNKYSSVMNNFGVFFWTAGHGSAPCRRAVARLVVKYLFVSEYFKYDLQCLSFMVRGAR